MVAVPGLRGAPGLLTTPLYNREVSLTQLRKEKRANSLSFASKEPENTLLAQFQIEHPKINPFETATSRKAGYASRSGVARCRTVGRANR